MSQRIIHLSYNNKELVLELIPLDNLRPHEMIIKDLEEKLTKSIMTSGILKDPITADPRLGMIIDGTHRWKALINLGANYIPTVPLRYDSEDIKLHRWIRIYRDVSRDECKKIVETIVEHNLRIDKRDPSADLELEHEEAILLLYKLDDKWVRYSYIDKLPILELLDYLNRIEENIFNVLHRGPDYVDEDNVGRVAKGLENTLILSYRKIMKEEVVDIFKKNLYLPPKTTRHVIPYRIIDVNLPIDYLRSERGIEEALKFLDNLKIEYLGNKIYVGERYYEEDVYRAVHKDKD